MQGKSDLLSAAVTELLKLPIDQRIAQDPQGDVAYLLAVEAQLRGDATAKDSALAHAAHAAPTSTSGREALAKLMTGSPASSDEKEGEWCKKVHAAPHLASSWHEQAREKMQEWR